MASGSECPIWAWLSETLRIQALARAEEKFVPVQSNVISLPRFSHFLKENSTL